MSRYITNPNRWVIVTEQFSGLLRKGVELLYKTVADQYGDFLSVYSMDKLEDGILENCNVILVGKNTAPLIQQLISEKKITPCNEAQGYSVLIDECAWNAEKQMVVIAGNDDHGAVYGCVDLCNQYCGYHIYKCGKYPDCITAGFFDTPFHEKLPAWSKISAPDVQDRGIWTWGHTIYDYRAFFDNMLQLKLNEVVIWNDYAPINAEDVVNYAHELGIKLIWGFAWGWGVDCNTSAKLDEEGLKALRDEIIAKYEREYAHSGCDGIYFQSFTELHSTHIGEKLIAETVVNFVNETAGILLDKYPDLHIQFGLHAWSVKEHTQYIAKVDPRVYIVWENCGCFPFESEFADIADERNAGDLAATREFVERITVLRGKEDKFGVVLKGMSALDWSTFIHQQPNLILGQRSDSFIKKRAQRQSRIWNFRQTNWIRHAEYVRLIVQSLIKNKEYMNIQGLVEDGMLEASIPLPVAIYAQTLWNCHEESLETVQQVMKYPCVTVVNL